MTIIDSQAKRDHEFESAFLQERVSCEPEAGPVMVSGDHRWVASSAISPNAGSISTISSRKRRTFCVLR
jgi:hypothetical protein